LGFATECIADDSQATLVLLWLLLLMLFMLLLLLLLVFPLCFSSATLDGDLYIVVGTLRNHLCSKHSLAVRRSLRTDSVWLDYIVVLIGVGGEVIEKCPRSFITNFTNYLLFIGLLKLENKLRLLQWMYAIPLLVFADNLFKMLHILNVL
jgi:hypothetical protein